MNTDQFWRAADDILTIYRSKYRRAVLTDDEQLENVGDFLMDMDDLASKWRTQEGKKLANKVESEHDFSRDNFLRK